MSSSPPDAVVLEHPRAEDAERVLECLVAFESSLLGESEWSLEELRSDWGGTDLDRDAWMALDGERVVGYLALDERGADWEFDGYVHPECLGRGIGAALAELGESEARRRGSRVARTAVLGKDEAAHRLFAARGFEVVRRFYRMRIELDERPGPVSWPEGLRETPFALDAGAEAVFAAIEEAFAEHWNVRTQTFEEWRARQHDRGLTTPWSWIVVRAGDEIAGVTILQRERFGTGWIGVVGVRPAWRRRGLGEAMMLEAFRRFWDAGERVVGLGVDAQNETGATRLYERVGMRVSWSATVFEKELS